MNYKVGDKIKITWVDVFEYSYYYDNIINATGIIKSIHTFGFRASFYNTNGNVIFDELDGADTYDVVTDPKYIKIQHIPKSAKRYII